MFAGKFLHKSAADKKSPASPRPQGFLAASDLDPQTVIHYGIPSTASVLAFDPVQSLLAIGTLDGRIKVIGGDNIEAILASPKQLPFKNLEFIQNQGFLVSISNENEIQVWDLDLRKTSSSLQWESNITAFSILHGTGYMYIGDEYGMVSVIKYNAEEGKLVQLPYYVPTDALAEAAGLSSPIEQPVVGLLPQPCSKGNRLLIAFSTGLLFLWDALEDRVLLVRGNKDLPLEDATEGNSPDALHAELSDLELEGKEISSLCWASPDGSVLAVGYVDGDILFWNFSDGPIRKSSNHAVKLQLSSTEKRLPVIVMHWCLDVSRKYSGKLFIYGGDVIGSEEVLTMLSLDLSSGMGGLKCVSRVDITLSGSFADMVLSPIASSRSSGMFLFLLTNPGQLHVYDDSSLASLMSRKDEQVSVSPLPLPMVVPTMDPYMTVTMFAALNGDDKTSRTLSEIVLAAKARTPRTPLGANEKWPLTGGVPNHPEDYKLERLLIAGYQDGSVRIWDATCPILTLIYTLEPPKVNGVELAGADASISALDFCSKTLCLAVGNEGGIVRLYKLVGHKKEADLTIVTDHDKQVHSLHQEDGPWWFAAFSILSSPVCALHFAQSARKLAVGSKCGRVGMLDVAASSVLFITNSLSDSNSPIRSLSVKSFSESTDTISGPIDGSENSKAREELILYAMATDAHVFLFNGNSGDILASCPRPLKSPTAFCMHVIEDFDERSKVPDGKPAQGSYGKGEAEDKPHLTSANSENHPPETIPNAVLETKTVDQRLASSSFLVCCEDALRLYTLKSLSQGSFDCMAEVKLSRPFCWMGTLKKGGKECGVLLLYRTGHMEVRSFPDLKVVGDVSLMSLLRWNFKTNMEKTVCSDDRGHVFLINGCEVAILSFLAHENGFRIPEYLPSLHDKVLAAAAEATFTQFPSHKKNQEAGPRLLGSIIKGFRSSTERKVDQAHDFSHLGNIFSHPPYLKPSATSGEGENTIELSIDDIEIDEPVTVLPSYETSKNEKKDKRTDKERLFEGASSDTQPRMRTIDEIKAKYRKAGETSAVASQARDKLLERQEKLERISERTAELQSGAENFASMAEELVKQMEKRKWWHL